MTALLACDMTSSNYDLMGREVARRAPEETTKLEAESLVALALSGADLVRRQWQSTCRGLEGPGVNGKTADLVFEVMGRLFDAWGNFARTSLELAKEVASMGEDVEGVLELATALTKTEELQETYKEVLKSIRPQRQPFDKEVIAECRTAFEQGDRGEDVEELVARLKTGASR